MGKDGALKHTSGAGESALKLTLTDRIPPDTVEAILRELRSSAEVGDPQYISMFNTNPPEFVQILGDALAWAPFVVAATEFLRRIASRAADGAWDFVAGKLNKNPIQRAAEALSSVLERVPSAYLAVGLDGPDGYLGTALCIESKNPDVIALQMAQFIASAADIESAMKREQALGNYPVGRAFITFEDGMIRIVYRNRSDDTVREVFVDGAKV